jgi:hypothetical protein
VRDRPLRHRGGTLAGIALDAPIFGGLLIALGFRVRGQVSQAYAYAGI